MRLFLNEIFNGKKRVIRLFPVLLAGLLLGGVLYGQTDQELELELSIDARECYVGESLTLQALVSGTDQVTITDLTEPDWGTITYLGGQRRNSQSITSINGKFTRIEEKGFLMSFQITPARPGSYTVPEIIFDTDGRLLRSAPFSIRAKAPEKSNDYAMELNASFSEIYPGQEFILDVKWFYRKGARSLSFSLPFLDDFEYLGQLPVRGRSYELVLNNSSVKASGEEGYSDALGEETTYLAFSLILKAKNEGTFDLSEASSRFEGVTGTETVRDFFGNKQVQEKYSPLVISAEGASLRVLPFPAPPAGSGITAGTTILGPASVGAVLSKTEISVGEPITLTLTFTGAGSSDFSIPPLNEQPGLERDFSIPPERSPGKNEGENRTFIQTIRVKNGGPTEFPPLTFPLFNTEKGEWEEITTEPIALTVLTTTVADSGDLEVFADEGPAIRNLEKNKSGLEASASGPELLSRKDPGPWPGIPLTLYLLLLFGPGVLWLLLFLRKIHFFGSRRKGASEFRRFLKKWKKEAPAKGLTLKDYEAALGDFMEAECQTTGRGIFGYEEALAPTPDGLEAYRSIKEILDRGIYAPGQEKSLSAAEPYEKLTEAGERLLKEMVK